MEWVRKVCNILEEKHLFNDLQHGTRFYQLVSCYCDKPFFTPGICKCIYLGAWDDEHFVQILSMMTELSFAANPESEDMAENGRFLADETEGPEKYIMLLSCSFVENKPFDVQLPDDLDDRTKRVISYGLKASAVIDEVCGEVQAL